MDKVKYGLQEFFNDQNDHSKMIVNIKFDFLYENIDKEHVWKKLMNIVLADNSHKHLLDMIDFNKNEYDIINKKMPLMFKPEQIKRI